MHSQPFDVPLAGTAEYEAIGFEKQVMEYVITIESMLLLMELLADSLWQSRVIYTVIQSIMRYSSRVAHD